MKDIRKYKKLCGVDPSDQSYGSGSTSSSNISILKDDDSEDF